MGSRSDRALGVAVAAALAPSAQVAAAGDPPRDPPLLVSTEDGAASLDPIPPATLPALTPAEASLEVDYTGAGIGQGPLGRTLTWMALVHGEVPLTTRRWHVGLAWDVVSAAAEGRGRALMYGNPEVWVRGVGFHESGVSAGGSLGFVIPLPRDLGPEARDVVQAVRVIRPWDSGYFESEIFTIRPSLDARLVLAPFVLQLRQGLDWSYDFGAERADILARTGTYLGVSPIEPVSLGVELWQVYPITRELPDDERAAITLSPQVRTRFGPIEPGLSVLFPITTPLEGIATDFVALRIHVRLALGRTVGLE